MILCRNGHPNPDGATYCMVCKVYIDATAQPVEEEVAPAVTVPPVVSLSEDVLRVDPGGEVVCEVRVKNAGATPDEFVVEVVGEPASLALIDPSLISLAPAAEGVAKVSLRPPPDAVPAGPMPIEIRVTARRQPDTPVATWAVLDISAPQHEPAPSAEVQPQPSEPAVPEGVEGALPGVFICYRHEDSPYAALQVYALLSKEFGEDRVFMDITIPPAVNFVEWIQKKIGTAGVVVAIIGRAWLAADAEGRRRIDDERDVLRNEIVDALERGMKVLPVLVDAARMPSEDDLPAPLAGLSKLQAHELRSDAYWRSSQEALVKGVAELLGEPEVPAMPDTPVLVQPPPPSPVPASMMVTGIAGALLLGIGLVLLWTTYITPSFRFLPVSPGVFTGPAPVGVLSGTVLALVLLSRRSKAGWLEVGLLAGFGFEAAVKGLSLIGDADGRVLGGGLLWLAGGAALGAAAAATGRRISDRGPADTAAREPARTVTALAVLGAAMLTVGAAVPFNVAEPESRHTVRVVWSDSWLGVDPIATALAVLVAAGLLIAGRRRLAAGLLIALGLCSTLLFVRYVGIPVAQWFNARNENVASPRAGGFIGLAGGLAVFVAGCVLARSSARDVHAAKPAPT